MRGRRIQHEMPMGEPEGRREEKMTLQASLRKWPTYRQMELIKLVA